jgi:hypothetical protein
MDASVCVCVCMCVCLYYSILHIWRAVSKCAINPIMSPKTIFLTVLIRTCDSIAGHDVARGPTFFPYTIFDTKFVLQTVQCYGVVSCKKCFWDGYYLRKNRRKCIYIKMENEMIRSPFLRGMGGSVSAGLEEPRFCDAVTSSDAGEKRKVFLVCWENAADWRYHLLVIVLGVILLSTGNILFPLCTGTCIEIPDIGSRLFHSTFFYELSWDTYSFHVASSSKYFLIRVSRQFISNCRSSEQAVLSRLFWNVSAATNVILPGVLTGLSSWLAAHFSYCNRLCINIKRELEAGSKYNCLSLILFVTVLFK